jgi:hypothetical protein
MDHHRHGDRCEWEGGKDRRHRSEPDAQREVDGCQYVVDHFSVAACGVELVRSIRPRRCHPVESAGAFPSDVLPAKQPSQKPILGSVDRMSGIERGTLDVPDRTGRRSANSGAHGMAHYSLRLAHRLRSRLPHRFSQKAHDTLSHPQRDAVKPASTSEKSRSGLGGSRATSTRNLTVAGSRELVHLVTRSVLATAPRRARGDSTGVRDLARSGRGGSCVQLLRVDAENGLRRDCRGTAARVPSRYGRVVVAPSHQSLRWARERQVVVVSMVRIAVSTSAAVKG